MKVYENNKEQVFKVEKVIICSSANATDLSESHNLQDLSIYQYTDIAVYIDNGEELSNKNTIKELYIDNISLESNSNIGIKTLNYKNILNFGKKKDASPKAVPQENGLYETSENNVFDVLREKNNATNVIDGQNNKTDNVIDESNNKTDNTIDESDNKTDNGSNEVSNQLQNETLNETDNQTESAENEENIQNDKINFNIVYTNEENNNANYDNPTFYTDCSNPITLEYMNKDIVTHYKMDENKSLSFDGTILKESGIPIESLNCKVKFKINIVNNNNEKYSCWINFNIPLDDIYEGTTMKAKTTNAEKYVFFRE